MKRNALYGLVLFLLAIVCSCDDEQNGQCPTGTILLGVEKNETLYTKAGVPVTNEVLSVSFLNEDGEEVKYFENYREDVEGERITLLAGVYTVVVSSVSDEVSQWDTPFYYGEEEVNILSGQTTNASVECRIANTKVSVEFSEAVEQYFSAYEAVVQGKSGSLTFGKEEKRAGFYFTDKLSVDLNLTNKTNGLKFQFNKLFQDIRPRYHYVLKFALQPEGEGEKNAGGDIEVTINEQIESEVECTILIPGYTSAADRPKKPEVEVVTQVNGGEISNHTSLDIRKDNDVIDTHQVIITTQSGLRALYFKLSESFTREGLPAIFDGLKSGDLFNSLLINGTEEQVSTDEYVYTLDLAEMAREYLQPEEESERDYTITLAILDNYQQEVTLDLQYTIKPNLPLLAFEPKEYNKWATFAVLEGFCSPEGTDVSFQYGLADEDEKNWQTVIPQSDGQGNWKALINGLEPLTDYAFRTMATIDGSEQASSPVAFTTAGTPVVPNLNFDDWEQSGKSWYLGGKGNFWDSGNYGANSVSAVNPTAPEYDQIVGGTAAAKLESKYVVIAFAAGNIYTGSFGRVEGVGASLNFGKPYTGRPTKLSGYYMYQPKLIDKAKAPYEALEGEQDMCSIYIALTDWDEPFQANTTTGTFVDFSSDKILAYGELDVSQCSPAEAMTAYEPFEIDIVYRDVTRIPKYVLIVASASRYGDYFTGGVGSTLYLDEFELHFDYNAASFTEIDDFE
ncbi:PCMD domain-containing protein [Parabacteroides sp. PF5-6]|uniref:PCMD domain-containing protein n=1 Tax=Parabacteroides sp. PF5-6 TaxID=1742403 RepID=UPI00240510ED|nr:PCMD domain-containing protein [Parabacteroides sp. PF5-6]MDF9831114.1 hypothetical protein [Parabacteroides sp. PF5-6]